MNETTGNFKSSETFLFNSLKENEKCGQSSHAINNLNKLTKDIDRFLKN